MIKKIAVFLPFILFLNTDIYASENQSTVLITGSNRNIGFEFVKQFANKEWRVIATTRSLESADDLIKFSEENKNVIVEQLDITNDEHLQFLKKKYKNEPIDILLNNAAYTPRYLSSFRGIDGVEVDATRKSFEVNTIGTMKVIQTFIDNVEESNNGKIVNLSTKAASFEERPEIPMMYSYAMSKAAMNSMVKTLSFETAEKNIIVIAISPGTVNTTLGMGLMGAIDIDESVSKMMVVIDDLTMDHNGLFLDYEDGREIGW